MMGFGNNYVDFLFLLYLIWVRDWIILILGVIVFVVLVVVDLWEGVCFFFFIVGKKEDINLEIVMLW